MHRPWCWLQPKLAKWHFSGDTGGGLAGVGRLEVATLPHNEGSEMGQSLVHYGQCGGRLV